MSSQRKIIHKSHCVVCGKKFFCIYNCGSYFCETKDRQCYCLEHYKGYSTDGRSVKCFRAYSLKEAIILWLTE